MFDAEFAQGQPVIERIGVAHFRLVQNLFDCMITNPICSVRPDYKCGAQPPQLAPFFERRVEPLEALFECTILVFWHEERQAIEEKQGVSDCNLIVPSVPFLVECELWYL